MKRLVWGIVITVFGVMAIATAGNNPQGPTGSIVFGILCLPGGGTLIYFGATYLKARNLVGDLALAMLREDGKIDSRALANRVQMGETKTRELISDLQRRGVIPIKTDIV